MNPNTAAARAPTSIASGKRIHVLVIAVFVHTEKRLDAYAPTHMKPACPRESSPRIPTVRLSETARITYIQIGTRSPRNQLPAPTATAILLAAKPASAIARVTRFFFV